MTDIYLHFLLAHYGLYGNAPVATTWLLGSVAVGAVLATVTELARPELGTGARSAIAGQKTQGACWGLGN